MIRNNNNNIDQITNSNINVPSDAVEETNDRSALIENEDKPLILDKNVKGQREPKVKL